MALKDQIREHRHLGFENVARAGRYHAKAEQAHAEGSSTIARIYEREIEWSLKQSGEIFERCFYYEEEYDVNT